MKTFIFFLIWACAFCVAVQAECDIEVSGTCFYYETKDEGGFSRPDAVKHCKKMDAELADIATKEEYDAIFSYVLDKTPESMLLLGMKYKYDKKIKGDKIKPEMSNGEEVSYKPEWFEGHPIEDKTCTEIILVVASSERFRGYINSKDGSVYSHILCTSKK